MEPGEAVGDVRQEGGVMAGRGAQSFQKRQKEMQRKEKQQEKQAKKQQRKQEPGHLQSVEDMTPLDGPVVYSDETDE